MTDENEVRPAHEGAAGQSTHPPSNSEGIVPPKSTRFKPGESGNAKGRPRGSINRKKIVEQVALETHTITEDGQRRSVTTFELILKLIRNQALDGNIRAFRACNRLLEKFNPQEMRQTAGYIVLPDTSHQTDEEILREMAEQQRKFRE